MRRILGGYRLHIFVAVILLLIILFVVFRPKQEPQGKVSEFGRYHGHTTEEYDGYKRTSEYLTMDDGTLLAYDLFLPTLDGVAADGPFPALFKYTPYGRAWSTFDEHGYCNYCDYPGDVAWYWKVGMRFRKLVFGNLNHAVTRSVWLKDMLKSGYAVIVIDSPGTGASFGQAASDVDSLANEMDELFNWIADQTWCDGNIGMFGDSIQARRQFIGVITGNPHLKAIMPATTWNDQYSALMFPGGVLNDASSSLYPKLQVFFENMATPVDSDPDGVLLAQALEERAKGGALAKGAVNLSQAPFRDSMDLEGQSVWIGNQTLYTLHKKINQAGVPVYLINGWYDIYARDNFMTYENLSVPKRLLVRPTDHSSIEAPGSDVDYAAEAPRWFDYWLKGINNGIMDEPPIHYYLQGEGEMQSSDVWPLENQELNNYYFVPGEGNSQISINDGGLDLSQPTDSQGFDAYKVDYTTTTGSSPHWTGLAFPHKYPEMSAHDALGLTYTTSPLETAINVIGHPVIHLWLSTEAPDLDVFVYLEEVDEKGKSTYITQGILRASHRIPGQAPFENFGLPWFNHFESELQLIPAGEPFELVFDLFPTAYQFSEGNQIRITITFADDGNFDTPILDPAPTLNLLRNTRHPTYIEMPIVQIP